MGRTRKSAWHIVYPPWITAWSCPSFVTDECATWERQWAIKRAKDILKYSFLPHLLLLIHQFHHTDEQKWIVSVLPMAKTYSYHYLWSSEPSESLGDDYMVSVAFKKSKESTNPSSLHDAIWFLDSLSGLKIQHCRELWCRSQMWLGSHVAQMWLGSHVAVALV